MKRLVLCALVAMCAVSEAFAWGQKGHDVVAYVAECHLSRRAARRITQVLEGHSPVYYANWMDNASHTPEYAYTSTWHYANVDEGFTYETMPRNENGDVITALNDIIARLRSGSLTPVEENTALRMLIHLMGDLHCPMHAGHKSDLGGNTVEVKFFGEPTRLHTVWDTHLVEAAHKWGYTEWQREIDRLPKAERRALCEGSLEEWFAETVEICGRVYEEIPAGKNISYDEVARYAPVIEEQLLKGGLRLAAILNSIYR